MDILTELNTLKADYGAANELLEASTGELEALKATLAAKDEACATFTATLAAKDSTIASLQAAIDALNAKVAELEGKQKTAQEKAVEIVATQGIAPITVTRTEANKPTREEALNEFGAITDSHARADYYNAHKALLLGR